MGRRGKDYKKGSTYYLSFQTLGRSLALSTRNIVREETPYIFLKPLSDKEGSERISI